jgi:SAM-dependent methyltransferase
VPDGYYAGYISIGVVEHRQEGPEPFLDEAYRILRPGGIALISVPFFHSLRRLKANLGFYRANPQGMDFYQYAYSQEEFAAYLERAGFEILEFRYYASYKGAKDEIPFFKHAWNWPFVGRRLRHRFHHSEVWQERFAHMIMAACRKPVA